MTTQLRYWRNEMVRKSQPLLRSSVAAAVLAALTQAGSPGLSLRQLAASIRTTDSAVQKALGPLLEASYVLASTHRGARRYHRMSEHPVSGEALRIALHELGPLQSAAVISRANADVEFAAWLPDAVLVVFKDTSDPAARIRLKETFAHMPGAPLRVEARLRREILDQLPDRQELREVLRRAPVFKGRIPRSFPDRRRPGSLARARPLHALHPSLRKPSRRTLQRLAREHGLARLALFGSAVRSDFRPDSDVDVVVRRRRGIHPSLGDQLRLKDQLGRALDRDVDVVEEEMLRPEFRPNIEREQVVLYGRP